MTEMLAGQVALVTGASSGLGLRFAKLIAQSGAKTILCGRRVDRLADVANEINAAGGTSLAVPLDVTDAISIENALARAAEAFGTVTILVNNAGLPDAMRAHKMPLNLIDQVIDTNLRGPFLLSCDFARRLMENKMSGRIVNISSMAAFQYRGGGAALYSTVKAGIARMTEVLAVEWAAYNINVNAIAPGVFESEMTDGMIARVGNLSDAFPRKRIGRAEQLDSSLLYLLSPQSDAVTGTVIKVDDGQSPR